MIIQIDHVAISSENFERDLKFMESVGYNLEFVERNIENLKIKKELMKHFSNTQSLALFRMENSLGIEILEHGDINHKESYITPIFENIPVKLKKILYKDNVSFISQDSNSNFQFNRLAIKSSSIKKSKTFWENFGFKLIQDEPPILEFKSIFNKSFCQVYLKEDNNSNIHFLDDRGFSCIAFITNSIERDRKLFKSKKIEVTNINHFRINNNNLKIFFAIGPSGELVELVEVEIGENI